MKLAVPNRQRLLLILAGAAVGLYVLDAVLFTPLYNLARAHAGEIARLEQSVGTGRTTIARATQIDRQWKDMQTNSLPKEPAQAEQEVLSAFDRWGKANNVELGSIRPQWKRGTNAQYSLLECRVDATGTLATLTRFMYELEKSPLALRVDSMEVTARDESGQRLTLGLIVSGLRLVPLERRP